MRMTQLRKMRNRWQSPMGMSEQSRQLLCDALSPPQAAVDAVTSCSTSRQGTTNPISDISYHEWFNRYSIVTSSPSLHEGDTCLTTASTTISTGLLVTKLLRLAFAALLAWATYAVTVIGASLKKDTLRLAGAAIAVSAALQFLIVIGSWISSDQAPVRRDVDRVLLNRLKALYNDDVVTDNPALISLHVFEVPIWFRRLFSYRFRARLRAVFPQWMHKLALRPRLVRIGEGGMRRLPPSGVTFRKGYGLVGIALQDNECENIYWVNFDDPVLIDALSRGPKEWKSQPRELTQNLRYEAAKRLANRYSEALALVIQDSTTGEALGCMTIEVAPGTGSDLRTNAALHSELRSTADLLDPILARGRA